MSNNDILPLWLDIKTACKLFSLSRPTLLKIINSGHIIAVKKVGKWLINRESLNNYLMEDFKELEWIKKGML